MTMTRRGFAGIFGKAGATIAILATLPSATACFIANVYSDLLKYSPVALAALQSVLSILAGNGIAVTPLVAIGTNLFKVGIADLQTAVTQYQNAPQGQKSTLLLAVSEALTVAEANINQFWSDLSIPDPKLASLIEGLLGVVTTTMAGFATQLPAATSPVAANAKAMRGRLPKTLDSTPTKRSVSQFRAAFNEKLKAGGEEKHAI